MELVAWNIVLAANKFNPSIFTPLWLVKNKIVDEETLETPCITTDAVSQIQTQEFFLNVFPEILQFSPRVAPEHESALVESKVWAMVSSLPQTPYTAIGVNFFWHVLTGEEPITDFTRRMFYKKVNRLYEEFDVPDAQFGAYFSKDGPDGVRVKLDIKPIVIDLAGVKTAKVQFAFNFHKDLGGAASLEEIHGVLKMWSPAKEQSEGLIKKATGK
jgi:hypothetical protein